MIYYQDYKIKIGFTDSGKPFWTFFRKGEKCYPNVEELKMLSQTFGEFKRAADRMIKIKEENL